MIKKTYSFIKDGQVNDVYTLYGANGAEVDILTYGGHITRISVPDRNGVCQDILVGCKNPEDYYEKNPYFGATVGRYGNRIGGAKFTIDGKEYLLEANDNGNCLHGGISTNFSNQLWTAEVFEDTLVLSLVSKDGDGGFPGNLEAKVSFSFSEENELRIAYEATTDKDTHCNLTNHAYFNLSGEATVYNHELMIKAKKITPTDEELIPHGEYEDIEGTPYSFMPAKTLGTDMFSDAKLIKQCGGYDFNYCLERETPRELEHFAYLYDPASGRRMDCYTTLPGVQLYTGNRTGGFKGKRDYINHCGICLETQRYPNTPNCPNYPTTLLKAGDLYKETTVYKFSVK